MSGELTIALNTQPHPPLALMDAYVRDANDAFREGRQSYIRNVLRLAELVSKAEKYAKKAGVSFRSLFRDDSGNGQHVDRPQFVFSRAKGMMLLSIARNPALVSGQHVDHLPDDYNSLSRLAQIPASKLTKLIESGKVTASSSRGEIESLVNTAKPKASQKPAIPNRPKTPLPEVAAPLPIASPGASQAVVSEPQKTSNEIFAPIAADVRNTALERTKAAIARYAAVYGWGAVQMDLIAWIEGQA